MRRSIFLFLLFFSLQTQAVHFSNLGPKDGLAHPAVLSISQDSLGRIWFGTLEGISIYDGNKIISYKPNSGIGETPLFKGNQVRQIVSSAKGDVFFRTNSALVKYDIRKGTFQTILDTGGFSLYSKKGDVWVTSNYLLYRWNEEEQQLVSQGRTSAGTIYDFLIDDKGRKWFTYTNGVVYTDDGEHFYNAISNKNIRELFQSSNGDIWVGSKDNGLFRIYPDGSVMTYNTDNAFDKGLYNNHIRGITEDKEGNIWFGTFNGLYKYNLRDDVFSVYTRDGKAGDISHSSVHPVFIDKDNILWAGTYFGGVNYASLHRHTFVFYNASAHSNTLSNPVVGAMTEDDKGNIWICTEGGGLNMLTPGQNSIRRFESGNFPYYRPHTNLKSILYDAKTEQLYIGTNERGLYTYDIRQNKFNPEIGQEKTSGLNTINAMERKGDTLFLSADKDIYVYSLKTRKAKLFQHPNMFANILLDAEQNLWVMTNKKIQIFDTATLELLHEYDLQEQGIHCVVTRAFQSSQKDMYIATQGNGVMRLNRQNNRFEPFPATPSSLLSNYCYQISETPSHDLIIVGDKGVAFVNREGEIQQTVPIGKYFPLDAFTKDCGLLVDRKGNIYIGGTNGLVVTHKKEQETPVANNGIYFAGLYVHNNLIRPGDSSGILSAELPFTQKISLPHNQNRIKIQFSTHASINYNQRVYEYRLKGVDKTWYQTTEKSVSYTNLTPGNYTLEVRESILFCPTPSTAQLRITVLPPWYASWWAWIIWTALFLAGVAVIFNFLYARKKLRDSIRKEQMEKQQMKEINEAKFKFFTSVSHEFRTPLTLIIGQLEVLLQENNLSSFICNKLVKVIHQCRQFNNLVTELIEFRKYEQGRNTLHVSAHPVNRYITEIYDGFRELALQQGIQFSLTPCEEETQVWFDEKQMIKVIYNLLSNAFKYTPKGGTIAIALSTDTRRNLLFISVTDSGVGINEKDIPYIFERFYQADNEMPEQQQSFRAGIGLALAKSIIEEHQGTIDVKSRQGQGSTFTISLQLGKAHLCNNPHILFEEEQRTDDALSPLLPDIHPEKEYIAEPEEGLAAEGGKPVIVLVEDNAELLEILVNIFSPLYTTRTASNGQEGLEIIREVHPDLVVSDIMMPVMSGTELCLKIKNNIELCHIPVILLTALNMPEQHLEGLIRGADDYIYKPFSPQILLARCNNIIRSRRILFRQFAQKAETDLALLATNNLDKEFLDKVTEIIDKNMSDPDFNIDRLASDMFMGRTSFYNKFKALTGMSPNDYINSYKLKQAAILLKQDNAMTISEISDSLGFSTPNYFCRKFKEQFGVAPSQYKQKE